MSFENHRLDSGKGTGNDHPAHHKEQYAALDGESVLKDVVRVLDEAPK